jgi:hypothetical protein
MCSNFQIAIVLVWLVFSAFPSSSFQFSVVQKGRGFGHAKSVLLKAPRHKICNSIQSFKLYTTGYNDNMEENSSADASEFMLKETPQPPLTPPQQRPTLDPLFLAVTKMDRQTARARSIEIPIWGELILDRSLFVLLPIFVFAVGGVLLSVFVLVNSGDTFVDAIAENSFQQGLAPSTSSMHEEGCRGLCSSQAQDLEGLRTYMQRLGGR